MKIETRQYYWSGAGSLATLNGRLVAPMPDTNIIETSDASLIFELDRMQEPGILELISSTSTNAKAQAPIVANSVDATDGISTEEAEQLDTTAADKLAALKAAKAK